ncbi:hypothetical protein VaNZ11_017008 [Volvox africanus]|uniref:Carboxypeptidase n=1 Tax=Volvox africanus TaxID=51714 RepID=A0ABQ5SNV9_9CHLO|nr:hypothetical protein VaNZ11_017008 [Volvox africanus]
MGIREKHLRILLRNLIPEQFHRQHDYQDNSTYANFNLAYVTGRRPSNRERPITMERVPRACSVLVMLVSLTFLYPSHGIRDTFNRKQINAVSDIKPTFAGYLQVDKDGSSIYYAYYESQTRSEDAGEAPILLWLQGGPGCASTFGGFYELGPWSVTSALGVQRNPGSWNRIFGLLLMDQPVGTGYSRAANGSSSTPRDEMGMAAHLYAALQGFFTQHHFLATRPLFITGESYAGKYVPSIAHYILQAQLDAGASAGVASTAPVTEATVTTATNIAMDTPAPSLRFRRELPAGTSRPVFQLAGVAVGNGLTDPRAQTQTLAAGAYYAGLLPPALRDEVAGKAAAVVALIDESKWLEAHGAREQLRSFIVNVTGLATLFDTRKTEEYDPTKAVDHFLNLPEVKEAMRADPAVNYSSCSDAVRNAMAADVMRTVKYLISDLLAHIPVLLYQGQYDILDGVASVTAWLSSLDWPDKAAFAAAKGHLWHLGEEGVPPRLASDSDAQGAGAVATAPTAAATFDATATSIGIGVDPPCPSRSSDKQREVAGWWRSAGHLTQVVVYRAGHMVPHDQPLAAQQMMEGWVLAALEGSR